MRSYQIYNDLREFATVDFVSCNAYEPDLEKRGAFGVNSACLAHIKVPGDFQFFLKNRKPHPAIQEIVGATDYDYIVVRYYITAYALGLFRYANLILDCDDCGLELMYQYLCRQKLQEPRWIIRNGIFWLHYQGYKRLYIKNLQHVRSAIFAKASRLLEWRANFHVLPNRISATTGWRDDSDPAHHAGAIIILFVGYLAYRPNFEGVDHFIEQIWPQVVAAKPGTVFKIVGGGVPEALAKKWRAVGGIRLCGFVEHIDEVYGDVAFSVSPIYEGSGTHIKVIESLVRGKTMVITPMSHRGYEDTLAAGESVLVAHTDAQFSAAVIQLIDDPVLRRNLASVGRAQVMSRYVMENAPRMMRDLLMTSGGQAMAAHDDARAA